MAAIIVHAGAYAIPDDVADGMKAGCEKAAQGGHEVLLAGKSAVDAGEIVFPMYTLMVACAPPLLDCYMYTHTHTHTFS